jgi:hypothetical protein
LAEHPILFDYNPFCELAIEDPALNSCHLHSEILAVNSSKGKDAESLSVDSQVERSELTDLVPKAYPSRVLPTSKSVSKGSVSATDVKLVKRVRNAAKMSDDRLKALY